MEERAFRRALPIPQGVPGCDKPDVLVPRADATPTSALLAPIEERTVSTRRRRRRHGAPLPSGFPVPVLVPVSASASSASSPSAGGKEHTASQTAAGDECGRTVPAEAVNETDSSFAENDRILAAMSQQEMQDAVEDIHKQLSPDMVNFLMDRARQKKNGPARGPEDARTAFSMPADSEAGGSAAADVRPLNESDGDDGETGPLLAEAAKKKPFAENKELAKTVADVLDLRHLRGERDDEADKLAWTAPVNDADTLPRDQALDEAVQRSVKALGRVAAWRFDLRGRKLSEVEVKKLPGHLGLHHHGTQPESAGYTLADLILLSRSSVAGQRVIAMNTLAGAISMQGTDVVPPLISSGGLSALFADDLPPSLNPSQTHNKSLMRAYLHLGSALMDHAHGSGEGDTILECRLSREQFYFASRFYSASYLERDKGPVLHMLSQSGCASHMVGVAWSMHADGDVASAESALRVALTITRCSQAVALSLISDDTRLSQLVQLAMADTPEHMPSRVVQASRRCTPSRAPEREMHGLPVNGVGGSAKHLDDTLGDDDIDSDGVLARIASDTVALCIAGLGWNGASGLEKRMTRLSELGLLASLASSVHTAASLEAAARPQARPECNRARGAMRVFRAAVAFGWCVQACASLLGSLAALSRFCPAPTEYSFLDDLALEAFLLMEAYAFAVFADQQSASASAGNSESGQTVLSRSRESDNSEHASVGDAGILDKVVFAREQMVLLLPLALESATAFAGAAKSVSFRIRSVSDRRFIGMRAAAGHFVATVFAMTPREQVFLSAEVVQLVCQVALAAARLASAAADPVNQQMDALVLGCSMVHATARILPRAALAFEFVYPPLQEMMSIVNAHCSERRVRRSAESHSLGNVFGLIDPRSEATRDEVMASWQDIIVNAASELLGLVSRAHANVATVRHAFAVLPRAQDPQVLADLVARCILNTGVLRGIGLTMGEADTSRVVEELMPVTLEFVLCSRVEDSASAASAGCSVWELFSIWLKSSGGHPEKRRRVVRLLQGYYSCGAVSSKHAYRALLVQLDETTSLLPGSPSSDFRDAVQHAGRATQGALLPGAPDTAISALSTAPAKPLVEKHLMLAEQLISYGPCVPDPAGDNVVLASVVLSAIMCRAVDYSLRFALWQRCVVECGGMALFARAELFGVSSNPACGAHLDGLVGEYAKALLRGIRIENETVVSALWRAIWGCMRTAQASSTKGEGIVARLPDLQLFIQSERGRLLMHDALERYGSTLSPEQRGTVAEWLDKRAADESSGSDR